MPARAVAVAVVVVALGLACDDSRTQSGGASGTGAAVAGGGGPGVAGSVAKPAALAFARALAAGDLEGAKVHSVGDDKGLEGLDAMMKFVASDAKFRSAIQSKFGETGPSFGSTFVILLEYAAEEVSGDTATISAPGAAPLQLRKQQDGAWKVDLNYDPSGRGTRAAEAFRRNAQLNDEVAAEVLAGKYKTAQEALDARSDRVRDARLREAGSSTAPATGTPGDEEDEEDTDAEKEDEEEAQDAEGAGN